VSDSERRGREEIARRIVQRVVGRDREIVLAAAVLAMASYETLEIWMFELPDRSAVSLAVAVHALQVVLILGATAVILRAWRQKTAHEEALARLVEKVACAQEEERRRVAYDVHDGIAQFIVSAKQHLDTCADLWTQEPARAEAELATGRDRLGRALVETRRVLAALRPSAIAADGLVGAMRRSLDEMAEENGWAVSLRADVGQAPLPSAVETAVFRIFQEAVANAARHAGTPRVDIDLRRDGSWLVLDVRDQGRGFVNGDHWRGLGLSSMQERARRLGGSCVIESAPRRGARLHVRLPLESGLAAAAG
jgi:signal transduction histidine kinase